MFYDPSSAPHLKPWLVRTLEPICDAEPGALADYILALLKHNVPESSMRNELTSQLDEFLENECSPFIDTLFTVLRTKSFLPYGVSSSPSFSNKPLDNGIPIPLDGLLSPSIPTPTSVHQSQQQQQNQQQSRVRKRSMEGDERDGRPPAKGPRLSSEGQFSRYGSGNGVPPGERPESLSSGRWGTGAGGRAGDRQHMNGYKDSTSMDGYGMNMGMGPGMGSHQMNMNGRRQQQGGYRPPDQKRGICRDYHNNGYCARGAMCKYSHGDDAVIPAQLYPLNGSHIPGPALPFMSMYTNGGGPPFSGSGPGGGGAYDPHESRMDMRPPGGRMSQRPPVLPRIQREDGSRIVHSANASGELPVIQDLTPSAPSREGQVAEQEGQSGQRPGQEDPTSPQQQHQSQVPPPPQQQQQQQQQQQEYYMDMYDGAGFGAMQYPIGGMNDNPYAHMNQQMDVDMSNPSMDIGPPTNSNRGSGNFRGGRGSNRGRGSFFPGEAHQFRPERRTDKTLVIEKIPEDKLTLEHINGWFKKFGVVTNVAIDIPSAKALVSFSSHEEAHKAWKSEDAVFNNRFVKLFWHKPMEGHGLAGARKLAASAPLVAGMTAKEGQPGAATMSGAPTATPKKSSLSITNTQPSSSSTASTLAAKQKLLEQQIAEQKTLMKELETASPEEKKNIMARLRKLGEEMTVSPTSTSTTNESPSSTTVRSAASPTSSHTQGRNGDKEQRERERLDKELELHSAAAGEGGSTEESSEDLKAKLERLKAEAASLGITDTSAADPSTSTSWNGGYRGGYRGGRGRGSRGYYRGAIRGGPPQRGSMKLDNRPKALLLKNAHEDALQAVKDWYEANGQLESVGVGESGDLVVTFKTRAAAEQGLAKGNNIPTVGTVQLSWYTTKPGTSNPTTSTQQSSKVSSTGDVMEGKTTAVNGESRNGIDKYHAERGRSPDLLHSQQDEEEEMVASGWGGDDDGDGMGML